MTNSRGQGRRGPRPARPVDLQALMTQAGTVTTQQAITVEPESAAAAGESPSPARSYPPLRTERERPRHAFRRGLSRSSGMWIWEPPQRSEDGGVPPCAREDDGPRTSRFGAHRAFVGGPSSCLGEQSPVSHHLKILIEDCLLTQGRRATWDWCARDEPRLAVGAAPWPALGGGSPLPPRESPSAGRTSNAGEMMMVCQPIRLRWSGRSRLATATGSP